MSYSTKTLQLGGRQFSLRNNGVDRPLPGAPLIVALHGGGYSSAYFDRSGFSLLEKAQALHIPVIALDRPGYADSEVRGSEDYSHLQTAVLVSTAIGALWTQRGGEKSGIVLVGHSIGGAIALMIAALDPAWPLLGVAVSGVGLANAPGDLEAWQSLPPIPFIEFPASLKDIKMFGAEGTYQQDAPRRSHEADAPAPRQELIDVVTAWPDDAEAWLAKVNVPIQYRQGGDDALWQVNAGEIKRFAAACVAAPFVDAALVEHAGHCIDFHHLGAAFQLEQLSFALRCGVLARLATGPVSQTAAGDIDRA